MHFEKQTLCTNFNKTINQLPIFLNNIIYNTININYFNIHS